MGQELVLHFVENNYNDWWFTARTVAEPMSINVSRVNQALNKLERAGIVKRKIAGTQHYWRLLDSDNIIIEPLNRRNNKYKHFKSGLEWRRTDDGIKQ